MDNKDPNAKDTYYGKRNPEKMKMVASKRAKGNYQMPMARSTPKMDPKKAQMPSPANMPKKAPKSFQMPSKRY